MGLIRAVTDAEGPSLNPYCLAPRNPKKPWSPHPHVRELKVFEPRVMRVESHLECFVKRPVLVLAHRVLRSDADLGAKHPR